MKKEFVFLSFCFAHVISFTQISEKIQPWTFEYSEQEKFLSDPVLIQFPSPDLDSFYAEEASRTMTDGFRIGKNIPVNLDFAANASWELSSTGRIIGRIRLKMKGALALGAYFSKEVRLPNEATLHVYSSNKNHVIGAFTSQTDGFMAMQMVLGDELVFEYSCPSEVSENPQIIIGELVYFFRGIEVFSPKGQAYANDKALNCQVDVACSEGNPWQEQIRSVVHYTYPEFSFTSSCSGTTMNNTGNDCKPYVLSAYHCGNSMPGTSVPNHVFYWNYQKTTCQPGSQNGNDPAFPSTSMTGATIKASSGAGQFNNPPTSQDLVTGSDFCLFQLNSAIPGNYLPYYAGWDITTNAPGSGVTIHHPAGGAKKISTYTTQAMSFSPFWGVVWASTSNGIGVTEGESSGAPLFNASGKVVGQLSLGSSTCASPESGDFSGKLDLSWDINQDPLAQLKDWLDPLNNGITSINGRGFCLAGLNEMISLDPCVRIEPNPSNGNFILRMDRNYEGRCEIVDLEGRIVYAVAFNSDSVTVKLDSAKSGYYLARITTNGSIQTKRIVVIGE